MNIVLDNVVKKFKRGKGLRKHYITACDHVSFTIEQGELFGLLGPNGAGKTTLVRCIATLLIPDEGKITIFGKDIIYQSMEARQQIGLLTSGERTLYWKLTGKDNLKFFAALYGLAGKERDKRIDYLMELLDLKDVESERVEKYSSGMKQKISLARALLHDPKILLLDEPTLGLDPQFSRFIRGFIKDELVGKGGKTVLLTTHYMDEADELCERIAFINKGKIVNIKSPAEYKDEIPHTEVLELRCQGNVNEEKLRTALSSIKSVEKVSLINKENDLALKVIASRVESILSDVIELVRGEAKILAIDVKEPTLEDVFIYLTGTSLKEDTREEQPDALE
ncbi:MAG: ABC transporter ATP-binding protein [candidate division WOR-3 bacterium]|nr:ABC transporter ATP-binding protein [candidate division WOR-3 bacterium]MDH5683545.1 ABC transporter ATP-binding protein [candidate division WOR-3 bacterium]